MYILYPLTIDLSDSPETDRQPIYCRRLRESEDEKKVKGTLTHGNGFNDASCFFLSPFVLIRPCGLLCPLCIANYDMPFNFASACVKFNEPVLKIVHHCPSYCYTKAAAGKWKGIKGNRDISK